MAVKMRWMVGITALAVVLGACSGGGDGKQSGENGTGEGEKKPVVEKPKDPYKMVIYAAGVSPEEFDRRFRDVLEKKFSHITFEYQTNTKGNALTDVVASGQIPDIIRIDVPGLKTYTDLKLLFDLSPMVKAHNYDLKRFNQAFVQDIIDASMNNSLYGLPVPPYFPGVLYYNKALFDKFGVAYPKDGMSWDDIYPIAQKMSRSEGGTQYRGLSVSLSNVLRDNPYSVPVIDPQEDRLASPDTWQTIFNTFKRFFDLPNNPFSAVLADETKAFATGNVALFSGQHNIYNPIPTEINWDIVSIPTIAGAPKRVGQRGPAYWTISDQSKHKDEAFEVIAEMLSDDVQLRDSRNGIPTTLANKAIENVLGQDDPVFKTKNMKAISYYPPSDSPAKRKPGTPNVSDGAQTNLINELFHKVATQKMDVNSALREADERLKKLADTERNK